MKKITKILFLATFLVFLGYLDGFTQCAMCRATVGSNLSEGRGVIGTGLNFGILYLLLMPYILVASLIFLWYRTGKKELAQRLNLSKRIKNIYN